MEVLEDAWAKELIWLDGDETYYPLGVTDPDYCVLRFTAERGRYYQNFSSEDFAVPGCVTCQLGAARATGGSARGSARAPRRSCRPSF